MLQEIPKLINDRFGSAFRQMAVAEEEIDAAMKRYPEYAELIKQCFLPLCPVIPDQPEKIYRAHVRELLERIPKGKALAEGTRVECMWAIMSASMKAPLSNDATALYYKLFEQTFDHRLAKQFGLDMELRESFAGAMDQLYFEAKKVTYSKARYENWDKLQGIPKNAAVGFR